MTFWISNASPLITLTAIDRLDLFAALQAEVRVPATVLTEVAGSAGAVKDSGLFVLAADVRAGDR